MIVIEGLASFFVSILTYCLEVYYKTNFALIQYHKYSLTEIENMIPWEEVYVTMLSNTLKKKAYTAESVVALENQPLFQAPSLPEMERFIPIDEGEMMFLY